MDNRADDNAVVVLVVEHDMRLKPEAPVSGFQVVGGLADAGEVREQAEGAPKPGKVGIGLVATETRFAVIIDLDKLGSGTRKAGSYPRRRAATRSRASASTSAMLALLTRSQSGCDRYSR